LSFSAGADSFSGSLSTLSRNQDLAFELMRLALTDPRFDEEPVERIRNQLLVSLARQEQDPDTLAWRTLRVALFPDHPYGRPTSGTPESVAAITVDDLRGYLADEIAQDRLFIGVSGDIDAETLGVLLDKTFGALPAESGAVEVADVTPHGEGGVMVIAREQPQSVVAMGQPGILRDDPDYYTAYTVNYILGGGGFQSRLYDEVREKRGLAYSVYSYLNPLDHAGIVVAGTATANPRVSESLGLILDEWRRMAEEGPTEEELADAKTYLTGSFPLRLSSTGKIAGMLVGMQLEGLGIDYLDKRNGYIEAVTLEDAKRVAGELYRPEALSVVVVGQPEGIEATRELPGAI
jgi:zinc protease